MINSLTVINIYIYKTEDFEAPTIFHVSTILIFFLFFLKLKIKQKPKPDKRPAFSFSKIQTLSSLYQLPPRSNPQQTNRDLLPQTHSKASKDTIPTDSSIKTHHTHHTAIPTNQ